MSVHLQDHMHLVSPFLSEHRAHRIQCTFSSMHVITPGRTFMCMGGHSSKMQQRPGCASIINLEW